MLTESASEGTGPARLKESVIFVESLPGPARRLRRLRFRAGYKFQTQAARAMGVSQITYNHHENGTRPLTLAAARIYARFFQASVFWLLNGETTHPPAMVLLVGRLRDDGQIIAERYERTTMASPPGRGVSHQKSQRPAKGAARTKRAKNPDMELFECQLPASAYRQPILLSAPGNITVEDASEHGAVLVDTPAMATTFLRGDQIFYRPTVITNPDQIHGRRCLVMTKQRTLFAGVVVVNPDNTVTILAAGKVPDNHVGVPLAVWPVVGMMCDEGIL